MLIAGIVAVLNKPLTVFALDDQAWDDRYRTAPAIILSKERTIQVHPDFSVTELLHRRLLINSEEGKSYGEIELGYDKSYQNVTEIEAFTQTADGRKLTYERIQDLNTSAATGVYSDSRKKVITMPESVKGSIIDWRAKIVTFKPVIPGNFYDHFHQTYSDLPVKEHINTLIIPQQLKLFIKTMNTSLAPVIEQRGTDIVYIWASKNNNNVQHEDFMPPDENINQIIFLSTLENWQQMSDWACHLFQKNGVATPELKKKVQALTKDKPAVGDKVQAIISYLQTDYRYVAMEMDSHGYEPHPASETYANKYGDCKDLTLLAIAMLNEVGVKAWPIIISSSIDLNSPDLLPMPFYFDHAFLYYVVDNKPYFTDILIKGFKYNETPVFHSSKTGFVINDKGGFFTQIPLPAPPDNTTITQKIALREDGSAKVNLNLTLPKSASVQIQQKFRSASKEDQEKLFAGLEAGIKESGKVLSRSWENFDADGASIGIKMELDVPDAADLVGDMLTFGIKQVARGTAFTAPHRVHPIAFNKLESSLSQTTYTLPVGYEIIKKPVDINLVSPLCTYHRLYTTTSDSIDIKENIECKPTSLPASSYPGIQKFYDDLTRLTTNNKVILKKISKVATGASVVGL